MKKNKKKIIILLLLVVMVGMGIGYSILSKQLKIEGTATIESNYDVAITSIEKIENDIYREYEISNGILSQVESVKAIENSAPSFTSLVANFDVTLKKDSMIIYKVVIENKGDVDSILETVTVDKSGAEAVNFVSPIDYNGLTLSTQEYVNGINYYFILSYDETKEINENELSSNISIRFDTKQDVSGKRTNPSIPYFLILGDNIVEEEKIVGVNLHVTSFTSGIGFAPCELYASIDGEEFISVGEYENKYMFPEQEQVGSYSPHTVKLKIISDKGEDLSSEVTLDLFY